MVDVPTSEQFNTRLTAVEAAIADLQARVAALTAGSTTPGAPAVSSVLANSVTTTGATLSGAIEGGGQPYSWQFEYGTTTSYGSVVPVAAGTGSTGQSVSTQLAGLTAGTTYHFRLKAVNAAGTTRSGDVVFSTAATTVTPTLTFDHSIQDTATGTGTDQVQYTGSSWTPCSGGSCVSTPDGSYYYAFVAGDTMTIRFTGGRLVLFAPDDTSGAPAAAVTVDGVPAGTISFAAAGMPANGQRWDSGPLGSTNAAHTVVITVPSTGNPVVLIDRAEVYTITAGGATVTAPTVTTNAATSLSSSGATVSGTITPNGATTTWRFEYGTTTGYGSVAPSPDASMSNGAATGVSQPLTGLSLNTTYHYRLRGVNSAGTTNSTDRTFVTSTTATTAAGRITRVGNKLMLNGKQYKFAGMNWDYGVGCGLAGSQPNAAQANQYFAELNPRSVTRLWVLPGMNLAQYDLVFAAAKANKQYLLVTLLNGLGDCTSFSASYGTPIASNISNWIQQVVSRHVGETTIMGYEAANESNEGDGNIANWYQAMAQAVKAIDPQVLFGTGGGNNSNNVGAITAWGSGSAIDMISYHDYYSPAGTLGPRSSIFNQAAQNANKVWYMGERGFCCGGGDTGNLTNNGQRLSAEYGLYLAGTGDVSNCAGYCYWDFKLSQPENVTANFGNGLWNAAKTYNNSAWNGS